MPDPALLPPVSKTHLVLMPSFNPGPRVLETVRQALKHWAPVWVIVDGSTDGTAEQLEALAAQVARENRSDESERLRVLVLPRNMGKGSAVLYGAAHALREGYRHGLTMDCDGQHPAASLPLMMRASQANPGCLVLGEPVFDASAPNLRVQGRKISNFWANLETLWGGIHDSLFGFRVYPLEPLTRLMARMPFARRFDFDPEMAVRLFWQGCPAVNVPVPCLYISKADGGVSQFRYFRDNVLLTGMHLRLMLEFLFYRLPGLLLLKAAGRGAFRRLASRGNSAVSNSAASPLRAKPRA
jgi:glycosyltransferase involved in cell wall biosynthesis